MLLRASNVIQANARKSNLNGRASRVSRVSTLKYQNTQASVVSGRDSTFDVNVSVEEEDAIPGIIGMSVHRCSMIKKYSIETFFTPGKTHKRSATAEVDQIGLVPGSRAHFEPVDSRKPLFLDQTEHLAQLPECHDMMIAED